LRRPLHQPPVTSKQRAELDECFASRFAAARAHQPANYPRAARQDTAPARHQQQQQHVLPVVDAAIRTP
jgi:hypothetical protein